MSFVGNWDDSRVADGRGRENESGRCSVRSGQVGGKWIVAKYVE